MSEPWGCIAKIKISDTALKKYLRSKQPNMAEVKWPEAFRPDCFQTISAIQTCTDKKVADFFAKQLYDSGLQMAEQEGLLFHYDEVEQILFVAVMHDAEASCYYGSILLVLLMQLAKYKDIRGDDTCLFLSPWTGDVYAAYRMRIGALTRLETDNVDCKMVDESINLFFSLMEKNTFPPVNKALRQRNYYYKPLKAVYKKYSEEQALIEKPRKIREATQTHPYHLTGYFYTYHRKVYERLNGTDTELIGADPFTFRELIPLELYADCHSVYVRHQGDYQRQEGIDGATFTPLNRGETTYWKDKSSIFVDHCVHGQRQLIKLESADINTFKAKNGFGFGRDKHHVYIKGKVLPIDPAMAQLTIHAFLYDDQYVYYYDRLLPLDGATFRLLPFSSMTNPFIGPFIVADKTGLYRYDTDADRLEKLKDLSPEEQNEIRQVQMNEEAL